MSDEFKAGDVVQLKSGGPKMTVRAILTDNDLAGTPQMRKSATVDCCWFKHGGHELFSGNFTPQSLKVYEASDVVGPVVVR